MKHKIILPPVSSNESDVCVRILLGKDMHSSYDSRTGYEKKWIYPSSELLNIMGLGDIEKQIKDDTFYTVKSIHKTWDYSGGLMGDSEGESDEVLYIEETPNEVLGDMMKIKSLQASVDLYKRIVREATYKPISLTLKDIV